MADVALSDVARIFLKIGAIGYGGPAIIGLMQHDVQEKRRWLSRQQFVEALGVDRRSLRQACAMSRSAKPGIESAARGHRRLPAVQTLTASKLC